MNADLLQRLSVYARVVDAGQFSTTYDPSTIAASILHIPRNNFIHPFHQKATFHLHYVSESPSMSRLGTSL